MDAARSSASRGPTMDCGLGFLGPHRWRIRNPPSMMHIDVETFAATPRYAAIASSLMTVMGSRWNALKAASRMDDVKNGTGGTRHEEKVLGSKCSGSVIVPFGP